MTRYESKLNRLAELRKDHAATKSLLHAVLAIGYDEVIEKLENVREWSEERNVSIVNTLIYFNEVRMKEILDLRYETEDNVVTIIKGDKRTQMDIATYIEHE